MTDLPDPLAPSTTCVNPSGMLKLTSSRTTCSSKASDTWSKTTAGGINGYTAKAVPAGHAAFAGGCARVPSINGYQFAANADESAWPARTSVGLADSGHKIDAGRVASWYSR